MSAPGWGPAPWAVAAAPPCEVPARCEVAVVGGGLAGLSTARGLARRGIDVALFEAERIGAGASGRTGGLVLEDTSVGPLPGVEGCIAALERVVSEESIDCDLSLAGCWELVHDAGPPLWRDGEGALCVAGTVPGGSLDCGKLLAGLARAAHGAGARLCEGARVTALERDGLRVGERLVAADNVVLTTNAYARELYEPGPDFASALTIALLSQPLPDGALAELGLSGGHVFYTQDLPYLWGRVLRGRLLVGGGLARDEDGRLDRIDVAADAQAARFDTLEHRVRGLHACLAKLGFEARWGGPIAFRASRRPILARVGDGRLIVTGAYAGHGVALSLRIADAIAAALADERPLPAWGRLAHG